MTSTQLTKIGTVTLNEVRTHNNRFETACWYETVEAQPQTVDLFFNGVAVCAKFDGVVTDAHFPSGFGGNYSYSAVQADKDAMKIGLPDTIGVSISLASKDIVMALVTGSTGPIEVGDMTLDIDLWFLKLITYDAFQSNVATRTYNAWDATDGTGKYDRALVIMTPMIAGVRCDTSHGGFNKNAKVREMVALASQWINAKLDLHLADALV